MKFKLLTPNSILTSIFLIAFFNPLAFAEYTIATVDFTAVINASSEAKKAKSTLESDAAATKKIIDEKKAALKPLEEKVKAGEIKPGTKEGNEVRQKTQELVQLMQSKDDELRKKYIDFNKAMAEKAIKVVSEYSKDKKIDLVLDKSQSTRGMVLFSEATFDITKDILSKIK